MEHKPKNKLSKLRLLELFPNHSELSNASIEVSDGYIRPYFRGDCVALQLKVKGNALLEFQLDGSYVMSHHEGTIVIFSMKNKIIDIKDLFKFYGDVLIQSCLCVDVFGNSIEANIKKDYGLAQTPSRLHDTIINMNSDTFINMTGYNSKTFKYNMGLKVMPKGTFKQFLKSIEKQGKSEQVVLNTKNNISSENKKMVKIEEVFIKPKIKRK